LVKFARPKDDTQVVDHHDRRRASILRRLVITLTFVLRPALAQETLLHCLVCRVLDERRPQHQRFALLARRTAWSFAYQIEFLSTPAFDRRRDLFAIVLPLDRADRSSGCRRADRCLHRRRAAATHDPHGIHRVSGEAKRQSSRVAATWHRPRRVVAADFTLTSSPPARRQTNFGVAPPSFLST
jgi:hypothetical protein